MARCPRCGKFFKDEGRLLRHMVHPRSQCKNLICRLIHLSRDLDLRPKQRNLRPTDPPLDSANHPIPPDIQMYDDAVEFVYDGVDVMEAPILVPSVDAQSSTVEFFPTAAKICRRGHTFTDEFRQDEHSQDRLDNVFYPFASKNEWELASWLTRASLSMRLMDDFFSLQLVRVSVHPYLMKDTHFILDTQPPNFFS
jgi:hypothetical protein